MSKISQQFQRRCLAGSFAIFSTAAVVAIGSAAYATDSTAVQALKFLNPVPEKGYLNKSQDRVIKKKAFKGGDTTIVEGARNKQTGLFAIVTNKQAEDSQYVKQVLDNPEINGLSVMFTWNELQPADSTYNWKPIDDLLTACQDSNKTLILRVSTCGVDSAKGASNDAIANSDTPKWVFDSGVKSLTYEDAQGQKHAMPLFWDPSYLANWSNFVQDLGKRYDKNPAIHSVGITGGGALGGTGVLPVVVSAAKQSSNQASELEASLKKDYGMTQRQLVQHWKYVADIFPKAFPNQRLSFDVEPPLPSRSGEDALDEISDYLAFRYGEHIYLNRQNVADGKHGFDQWRVLCKFRGDTLTAYSLTDAITAPELQRIAKYALDDGVSYLELPAKLAMDSDPVVNTAVHQLANHLGFEILAKEAVIPKDSASGEPLKVSFTVANLGDAVPMRPLREFDKDVAGSFKVALEFCDTTGKPVVVSLHTPNPPTTSWSAGKPVSWEESLKMPEMTPGQYTVFMSLVDPDSQERLMLLNGLAGSAPKAVLSIPLGTINITEHGPQVGSKPAAAQ